jgi:hypothetical protein
MTALWGVGQIRMGTLLSNALYLPGISTNYVSTPDSPANSIPGDIEMSIVVAPVDWTPAADDALMAKVTSTGILSWQFLLLTTGQLMFMISRNGTTGIPVTSTVATGFTNGTKRGVRVTRRQSDGRTQFFTSPDGISWSQLGSDLFTAATRTIFDSTAPVTIGARDDGGDPYEGIVYSAELRDGIGGTVIHSFDAAAVTKLGTRNPSSVSAGGPWAVNGSGWDWVLA